MAETAAWNPLDLDVTFSDGRTERVRLSLRARVEVERKWPGVSVDDKGKLDMRPMPGLESALYGAWITLGKPDKTFDKWTETVVALVEVPGTEAGPTEPAPGDDS